MKSLVQEASSVSVAVEKAWNDAGQPREFTVKILNRGRKSFFGFTKEAAVISLLFAPQGQQNRSKYQKPHQKDQERRSKHHGSRFEVSKKETKESLPKKIERSVSHAKPEVKKESEKKVAVSAEKQVVHYDKWEHVLITDISLWVKDVFSIMKISNPYKVSSDGMVLHVVFNKILLESEEQQRMLFAGLAHLFMQGLKKKYRNKFKGFRLIFSTPPHEPVEVGSK